MSETEPLWLNRTIVDAIQEDQRQQHGGHPGVLNDPMIESALARPRNRFAYAGADVFACAASYVFGLAKNHGYQDANKRTAYMAGLTFLRLNGYRVTAGPQEIVALMLGVATDDVDEPGIAAQWSWPGTVLGIEPIFYVKDKRHTALLNIVRWLARKTPRLSDS